MMPCSGWSDVVKRQKSSKDCQDTNFIYKRPFHFKDQLDTFLNFGLIHLRIYQFILVVLWPPISLEIPKVSYCSATRSGLEGDISTWLGCLW